MQNLKKPSFGACLFILLSFIVIMGLSLIVFEIPVHVAMLFSLSIAIGALIYNGFKWDFIMSSLESGGRTATTTVLILSIIGMVMGSWIASGTVPAIIYWGFKLINPKFFLLTSCLVCIVIAFATGSSWSTAGTIGVALMAIGSGLGINPAITAGTIVSGANFGNKMSPLSDTTNLATATVEGELFSHIKTMLYTTIPAMIVALLVYTVIGAHYKADSIDFPLITEMMNEINSTFNLNILVFLPLIFVIFMALAKVPALISLFFSVVISAIIAISLQGSSLTEIAKYIDTGFISKTGIKSVDTLLTRGGLQSMSYSILLTLVVIPYGVLLEKTQVLNVLLEKFEVATRTLGTLVMATVLTAIGLNIVTASQYMSIVITGRMYLQAYKNNDMKSSTVSRILEDSGTVTSVLIPWNLCGIFFAGTLGVKTIEYLPYAVFNWLAPMVVILFGWFELLGPKKNIDRSTRLFGDSKDENVS